MHKNPFTKHIRQWAAVGTGLLLLLLALAAANFLPVASAQQANNARTNGLPVLAGSNGILSGQSVHNDTSPPLRAIPPAQAKPGYASENEQRAGLPKAHHPVAKDPVLQQALAALAPLAMPAPIRNFEGVYDIPGVSPPDTNGDVGPNHYIQWVNDHFEIFDKSGTSLYGPVQGNTLWVGFGGPCEYQNDGDPLAVYDNQADRWVMSQFAFLSGAGGARVGPYYQCFAVSATPDPLGAWHRYAFKISDTIFNDYGKVGVWPEAYYATFNMFGPSGFAGGGFAAFDRAQMLAGQPAGFQFILEPNAGGDLPSDLDGHASPPAGAPNMFLDWWDNAVGEMHAWYFHADFNNPANSTFTGPVIFTVAPWNIPCGFSRDCIPQPGTTQKVDAISDRMMYRLAYRNFGDHESWVTNHTVDVSPVTTTVQTAVRWYELRNSGTITPTVYQQGTYAGDSANSENRWMGSVAMDGQGNLAAGYSVSSNTVYPSIRYTGRLVTDTLGTLPQGETTLINGSGSQTGSNRWGDYSAMQVDPVDDCTFWYTQEYYQLTNVVRWQTRVGSFKFPGCTAVAPTATPPTAAPTVTPQNTATTPPGATATSTPQAACASSGVFNGAITGSDPVHANFFARTVAVSECDAPKPPPGITAGGLRHYDTYTFYNPSSGPQCITIDIMSNCNYYNNTRLFSAAYLGSFDPTNLTANWLGDDGIGQANANRYQITVPGNSTYVVMVDEIAPDTGCPSYSLQVSCGIAGGTPTVTSTPAPVSTATPTVAAGTATATPQPVNCPLPFTDVDQFNPFYQYIQCLYCRGIISGYADNTFRWTADVTRGQVSKIIANSAGFNEAVSGQTFTDVPSSNPFYLYIERLVAHGDISGYNTAANCPSGVPCFRWELPVTRGQLAKIDANAAGYNEDPGTTPAFKDVAAANPFYAYIQRLSLHGVISGYTCGGPGEPCPGVYYRPNANITRGQVSKVASQTFFPNACAPAQR